MRFFGLLLVGAIALFCTSVAQARTVALVFDDSGSMKETGKWDSANYSVQTLRALLADDDRLLLLAMNTQAQWRSSADAGRDITDLERRCRPTPYNTPYESVERAVAALAATNDPERWLIVATDGNFDPAPDPSRIEESINDFLSQVPGGRVILLGIGEGIHNPVFSAWQRRTGASLFDADSSDKIIASLGEIAALVASHADSRLQLHPLQTGDILTFTPEFPVKRLTILQQETDQRQLAAIVSARAGATALRLYPPRSTATPGGAGTFGLVSQIVAGGGKAIPAGTPVELMVQGSRIDPSRFVVIPEVDARLESLFRNGRGETLPLTDGRYRVCRNDGVQAELRLVFPQQGAEQNARLGTATAEIVTGGGTQRLNWQPQSNSFVGTLSLQTGTWPLSSRLSFPGYFNFRLEGQLEVIECEPRRIDFAIRMADGQRGGKDEWRSQVTELATATPLELVPMIDGREATATEIKGWNLEVSCGDFPLTVTPPSGGNNRWKILPKIEGWCVPCIAPTGRSLLTIQKITTDRPDDKVSYLPPVFLNVAQASFFSRCWLHLLLTGIGLFLLWYLPGILKKPRFTRQAYIDYRSRNGGRDGDPDEIRLANHWFKHYFWPPYSPEKRYANGLIFQALPGTSQILLPHEQFEDGAQLWVGGRRFNPDRREDFRVTDGETIKKISGINEETYRYHSHYSN